MKRIALGMLALGAAALFTTVSLPAVAAQTGNAEIVTTSGLVQTAAKKAGKKKAAKKAAKKSGKSCGTYMYPDKKSGKCVDARAKK